MGFEIVFVRRGGSLALERQLPSKVRGDTRTLYKYLDMFEPRIKAAFKYFWSVIREQLSAKRLRRVVVMYSVAYSPEERRAKLRLDEVHLKFRVPKDMELHLEKSTYRNLKAEVSEWWVNGRKEIGVSLIPMRR